MKRSQKCHKNRRNSDCHDTEKIQKMRNEGNRLLKKLRKKTTMNRGREIDEKIKEIDELHDESKMFRAVKALNRKKFENPFVHDKDGKNITNPNEIYRTVRNHFKNHFYDENVEKVSQDSNHSRRSNTSNNEVE